MKSNREKKIKIFLELDEEEARWLRDFVQNPMTPIQNDIWIRSESNLDAEMRGRFFDALVRNLEE